MPHSPRELKPNYCYHVTVRCNNREFKLSRYKCREVFLYAIGEKELLGQSILRSLLKSKSKAKKSPGQMSLTWDKQMVTESTEVHEVA